MVSAEGATFGWLLVVIGTLLLVAEALNPGFFIAVPGTVLIILGILLLLGVDIFTSAWGVLVGVIIAIVAATATIWFYSRMTADDAPTTLSRDSLVGREGQVTIPVNKDSIDGKVLISGQEWSARSVGGTIPKGKKVKVVRSEGVHIVVEEVE
jgi:membrane-bound ClpP family serine protease